MTLAEVETHIARFNPETDCFSSLTPPIFNELGRKVFNVTHRLFSLENRWSKIQEEGLLNAVEELKQNPKAQELGLAEDDDIINYVTRFAEFLNRRNNHY